MDNLTKYKLLRNISLWYKYNEEKDVRLKKYYDFIISRINKILLSDYSNVNKKFSEIDTEVFWLINKNSIINIKKYFSWELENESVKQEVLNNSKSLLNILSVLSYDFKRSKISIKKLMLKNIQSPWNALEFFLLYFLKNNNLNNDFSFEKSEYELEDLKIDYLFNLNWLSIANQLSVTNNVEKKRKDIINNLNIDNELEKFIPKFKVPKFYSFLSINWELAKKIRAENSNKKNFFAKIYKNLWSWIKIDELFKDEKEIYNELDIISKSLIYLLDNFSKWILFNNKSEKYLDWNLNYIYNEDSWIYQIKYFNNNNSSHLFMLEFYNIKKDMIK